MENGVDGGAVCHLPGVRQDEVDHPGAVAVMMVRKSHDLLPQSLGAVGLDGQAGVSRDHLRSSAARLDRVLGGYDLATGIRSKTARIAAGRLNTGSPSWARTSDLRINSPSLYRLSYRGMDAAWRLR